RDSSRRRAARCLGLGSLSRLGLASRLGARPPPQHRVAVLLAAFERQPRGPGGFWGAGVALDEHHGIRGQPRQESVEYGPELGFGEVVGRIDEEEVPRRGAALEKLLHALS